MYLRFDLGKGPSGGCLPPRDVIAASGLDLMAEQFEKLSEK